MVVCVNEGVELLINSCLNSPYVFKDEPPLSLMIIGDAGVGKTTLLNLYKGCRKTIHVEDLDSGGMREQILYNQELLKVKHIFIPDFNVIASKRSDVRANIISLFLVALEEGITKEFRFKMAMNLKKPFRFGIITALTPSVIGLIPKCNRDAFLSRMLICFLPATKNYHDAIRGEIRQGRKMTLKYGRWTPPNKEQVEIMKNAPCVLSADFNVSPRIFKRLNMLFKCLYYYVCCGILETEEYTQIANYMCMYSPECEGEIPFLKSVGACIDVELLRREVEKSRAVYRSHTNQQNPP